MSVWHCKRCGLYNALSRVTCQACFQYYPELDHFLNSDIIYTFVEWLDYITLISIYKTKLSSKLSYEKVYNMVVNLVQEEITEYNFTIEHHFNAKSMSQLKLLFCKVNRCNLKLYTRINLKSWNQRVDVLTNHEEEQMQLDDRSVTRTYRVDGTFCVYKDLESIKDYGIWQMSYLIQWFINENGGNKIPFNIFSFDYVEHQHDGYDLYARRTQKLCVVFNGNFFDALYLKLCIWID
eukprot:349981_1